MGKATFSCYKHANVGMWSDTFLGIRDTSVMPICPTLLYFSRGLWVQSFHPYWQCKHFQTLYIMQSSLNYCSNASAQSNRKTARLNSQDGDLTLQRLWGRWHSSHYCVRLWRWSDWLQLKFHFLWWNQGSTVEGLKQLTKGIITSLSQLKMKINK